MKDVTEIDFDDGELGPFEKKVGRTATDGDSVVSPASGRLHAENPLRLLFVSYVFISGGGTFFACSSIVGLDWSLERLFRFGFRLHIFLWCNVVGNISWSRHFQINKSGKLWTAISTKVVMAKSFIIDMVIIWLIFLSTAYWMLGLLMIDREKLN